MRQGFGLMRRFGKDFRGQHDHRSGGRGALQKQKGGALKSFLVFFVVVFVLSLAAIGAGGYFAYREVARPGPLSEEQIILLKPGLSVAAIGQKLAEAGAVRHPELFTVTVRVRQVEAQLKAGEYALPAEASVMEIIDLLVAGKSILHYFTAAEGLTTAQILRLLEQEEVLSGEITLAPQEGTLLPETYALTRGETRDGLIQRMQKAQEALLDDLWEHRALELPITTRQEAIILASVVEKEAGGSEHAQVASVFMNRLRDGKRLEADATLRYGLNGGEPLLGRNGKRRGLRQSELDDASNRYNSYKHNGLPPTAISNPGRASIEGVLNPPDTPYYFFVADGTGGHAFAETYSEHKRNVAKWRRIERALKQQ